ATPNLLTATEITANRSLTIFVGQTTTINGLVLVEDNANITSIDLFSALGVATSNGDLSFASQQSISTNLLAGLQSTAHAPALRATGPSWPAPASALTTETQSAPDPRPSSSAAHCACSPPTAISTPGPEQAISRSSTPTKATSPATSTRSPARSNMYRSART